MTKEELITLNSIHCNNRSLDVSERAIIEAFKGSGLSGWLYAVNYGAGGITFSTEDQRNFYICLEPEYDEDGNEKPRRSHGVYRLIETEKEHLYEDAPPIQTLEEIFQELKNILKY